jgi:hypothetical protein
MADERDPKVTQRYRELGAEQPSRELDQAILAAAHRAADSAHAPLVTPAGRHRWYFSLGAIAVLVLAVAITLHVDRDQPQNSEAVAVSPPAAAPAAPAPARDEFARRDAARANEEAKPAKESALMKERRQEPPAVLADRLQSAPAAPQSDVVAGARAPAAKPAPALERAKKSLDAPADTPERELERIAELRKLGRDEDADKALAEFRKRYPDYQMSAETRAKVERAPAKAR